MNEEIQQWFTEHGKVIKAEPIEDKASPVPGATLLQYTFEDGAKLTLRPAKYDNGVEVSPQQIVSRELPKPKEEAASAQTPAQQRTAREEAEIAANAALPPDQDPRPETNAERAARAERNEKERAAKAEEAAKANAPKSTTVTGSDGKPYIVTQRPGAAGGPPTVTVTDAAGNPVPGNAVPGKPDATKPTTQTATEPLKGHPGWRTGTRRVTDGQGNEHTETYYIDPAGNPTMTPPETAPVTATDRKPVKEHPGWSVVAAGSKDANGNTVSETYYLDPEGNRQASLPDTSAALRGVPSYTPDLTKPGAGLIERARQLDDLVAAGTITYQQRQEVLKNDQVLAQTVANEFNVGVTLLREDYANQTSQRNADVQTVNTRAGLSNQHLQNAIGLVEKFAPYLGATPGDAGKLFTGMLAVQVAHATALGGLKDVPREQMHPNLRGFAERATAGAAGAPAGPGATPGAPLPPGAPAAATPPNALGLGAIGSTPAPGGPAPPSYDVDQWDRGPNGTLVPRERTPSGSAPLPPAISAVVGPGPTPTPPSWREEAAAREQVAMAQQLLGQPVAPLAPLPEPVDVQAGLPPVAPILDTAIPGLTPELDLMAKRELDLAISGGHW